MPSSALEFPFSVLHQSYHMCKEVENNSASVPPKEELSTQVLISSIFCEDRVPFLRDPSLDFENICYSFKREKLNPTGTIYGGKIHQSQK